MTETQSAPRLAIEDLDVRFATDACFSTEIKSA